MQPPVPSPSLPAKSPGQRGYEAQYAFLQQHEALPSFALEWERLPALVREAWEAAAKGVLAAAR